jgi:hypothetical protein
MVRTNNVEVRYKWKHFFEKITYLVLVQRKRETLRRIPSIYVTHFPNALSMDSNWDSMHLLHTEIIHEE